MLWVGVRRRPSCVVRRLLTSYSQELLGQSKPYLVCSICRVRKQEIVNVMTPIQRGGNFGVKSVKLLYFFKNLLLYPKALIKQTNYVVMMTKEGSTKIVNFMTPGVGVLVLGRGHISHIVKMHYLI